MQAAAKNSSTNTVWVGANIADVLVGIELGLSYTQLVKFWTLYRDELPVPNQRDIADMIPHARDYAQSYLSSPSQTRYPLDDFSFDTSQLFGFHFGLNKKPNPGAKQLHSVLTVGGFSMKFAEDYYGDTASNEKIKFYLMAYTSVEDWHIRFVDLYIGAIGDRVKPEELETMTIIEFRGLSHKFFAIDSADGLDFAFWESMIESTFLFEQMEVTYGRLDPCTSYYAKLILEIPREAIYSRFATFKTCCISVEEQLSKENMFLGKDGGIYPLFGTTPFSKSSVVDDEKAEPHAPKPTPSSQMLSGSRRRRVSRLLQPRYEHDHDGDCVIPEHDAVVCDPIVVDELWILTVVPMEREAYETLRRFERQLRKECDGVLRVDLISYNSVNAVASLQIELKQSECFLLQLAQKTEKIIFRDGSEYPAQTKSNRTLPIVTQRRKRSLSDSSLVEAARRCEPERKRLQQEQLYGRNFE